MAIATGTTKKSAKGDFLPRAVVGTPELHDRGFVETDQSSLELRLGIGPEQGIEISGRRLLLEVGKYAGFHAPSDYLHDIDIAASIRAPAHVRAILADNVNTLFPTATSRSLVEIENYAVFGQATYDFTDWIGLTVGARWTHDSIDYAHARAAGVNRTTGLPATGAGISGAPAGGTVASGGNGTVSVDRIVHQQQFLGQSRANSQAKRRSLMLFGSYTRGYKGPAFNVFFNHTAPDQRGAD